MAADKTSSRSGAKQTRGIAMKDMMLIACMAGMLLASADAPSRATGLIRMAVFFGSPPTPCETNCRTQGDACKRQCSEEAGQCIVACGSECTASCDKFVDACNRHCEGAKND